MLHPALYHLMRLQLRGMVRRMSRGAGAGKKMVFLVVGAVLLLVWVASSVMSAVMSKKSDPARVRLMMPLVLLGICLVTCITSAGDKAIAFTPGEVDQLFPGPFSRRELLFYKLLKSMFMAALTGLILSLALLRHARWWPACFAGVFLSLLFIQFFSIAIVLGGQTIGLAAYTRARRLVIGGAIVAAVVLIRLWVGGGGDGAALEQVVQTVRGSQIGHVLFAPLEPFGNAMTSTHIGDLLKWFIYAGFLVAALLAVVVLLDANYLEAAMGASQRRYEKIQRIRGGSFLSGVGINKQAKWRIPQFPWAGGAGPIAWRQITNAFRSSRGLLLLLIIIAIGAAPLIFSGEHGKKILGVSVGVTVWLTFLTSSMINFDFRGDVDQMDTLKALPINSIAVTIGQLISPVLVMSVLHLLVLAAAAVFVGLPKDRALAAAVIVIPFNTLLFCSENLVFLLFPSRPAVSSPGDLQILGRKFVFMLMKGVILMTGLIAAGTLAGVAWVITGKSLLALTSVAWAMLSIECAGLVPLIAWAYRKFDPSVDTPA